MKNRIVLVAVVAAAALVLAGCSAQPTPGGPKKTASAPTLSGAIVVDAASSLTGTFDTVAAAFKKANPNVTVTFNYGGSGTLVAAIVAAGVQEELRARPGREQRDVANHEMAVEGQLGARAGEAVAGMAGDFLDEFPDRLAEIHRLDAAGKWPELERAAHSLKGLTALFGFQKLSENFLALEDAAEATDAGRVKNALAGLDLQISSATQRLCGWLESNRHHPGA